MTPFCCLVPLQAKAFDAEFASELAPISPRVDVESMVDVESQAQESPIAANSWDMEEGGAVRYARITCLSDLDWQLYTSASAKYHSLSLAHLLLQDQPSRLHPRDPRDLRSHEQENGARGMPPRSSFLVAWYSLIVPCLERGFDECRRAL